MGPKMHKLRVFMARLLQIISHIAQVTEARLGTEHLCKQGVLKLRRRVKRLGREVTL